VSDATLYRFRRNLVVAASAGTGKTHALVGVLVHLVLGASELGGDGLHEAVDPARIVATTFSRKAAAEIRARFVRALSRLAAAEPDAPYRADLDAARARVGASPWTTRELVVATTRALARAPFAEIGTLHSFAATIVRDVAPEIGLSPSFRVADQDEASSIERAAIERALGSALDRDEAAVQALARAAGGAEPLVAHIGRLLGRLLEEGYDARDVVIADDAAAITSRAESIADFARMVDSSDPRGAAAAAFVHAVAEDDAPALETALVALWSTRKTAKLPDAVRGLLEERDASAGKTNEHRARVFAQLFGARHAIAESARFARDLLAACDAEIRAAFARESALDFGGVLRAARDALRDHPAIAASVGARYDALLVDEFQDTSRLQRQIVELLWERDPLARAPGTDARLADLRPAGLFVVGDRKQSIYSFRGADVGVFTDLCVGLAGSAASEALDVPPRIGAASDETLADFVALRHNRRAIEPLLTFANAFSARRLVPADSPPKLYEIAYAPATEDLLPPPDCDEADSGPATTWLRVADDGGRGSDAHDEAAAIAAHVTGLVDAGGTSWRDCAVLASTNAMLDATAFAFARAGIPYVVAGSGFFAAQEVRDVVAMLALVVRPDDRVSMLTVLRGPWLAARDDTLLALCDADVGLVAVERWREPERLARAHADDRDGLVTLARLVLALRASIDRIGAAAALREAVAAADLEAVLIQLPRGVQRVANVRKLLEMAGRSTSARALLAWIRDATEREAREVEAASFSEEDDAVRLLTVHASKGLAFPVVFVPQVGKGARPASHDVILLESHPDGPPMLSTRVVPRGTWEALEPPSYERAIAEARRRAAAEASRLAYVAITRAERALVLVGDRRPPKGEKSAAYLATHAAVLDDLAADVEVGEAARLEVRVGVWTAPTPRPRDARPAADAVAPLEIRWQRLPLGATALQDFAHCARRFELARLVGMPEPPAPGAAADAYADDARAMGARVSRDAAFVVEVDAGEGRTLVLRGAIERLIRWPDGSVDAVDTRYARAAADDRHETLRDALGLGARFIAPDATAIRVATRVEESGKPAWHAPGDGDAIRKRLGALAVEIGHARATNAFDRAPNATCVAIACGYAPLCYPAPNSPSSTNDA
jgi:ATP-dependent helicase/nuclease subunit A